MDIGLMTVTTPGQSDTDTDINFCIKYYPQLYNVSENATSAEKYKMEDLVFLNHSQNLCDEDTFTVDIQGVQFERKRIFQKKKRLQCTVLLKRE